ncbi:YdcF family protein [Corynebacterium yudongzhengii]|uniref:YdcF family protein n=1 Tax=Corynebacterium yudongzhengii TaxID=2080740 RepID=A0A2U1T747_9CORY|nr:YdcF family protein [Corynebacterium yudongzhengii]AWB81381.1 YdcF family protein [Corynebacterium yudongzhengii]PWC01824.1 YdcF family protein [Corynebacterium yudongzhengii]
MENILILGCRVRHNQPRPMLAARLHRALPLIDAHLRTHPATRVVVSGAGEAEVMAAWLYEAGVPGEAVVVEKRARSTNENLENAHALLPETTRWLVVTSDFHARRTRVWAWHLQIPVRVLTAKTPRSARYKHYLREVFAFPHSVLRVIWRRLCAWLRD